MLWDSATIAAEAMGVILHILKHAPYPEQTAAKHPDSEGI